MKQIIDFAKRLRASEFSLESDLVSENKGRCFLLSRRLRGLIRKDFFYAGVYLGKVKSGKFFPSFNLLALLSKCGANGIVLDRKAAWLFICGRDLFAEGIIAVRGSVRKGGYVLVLNEFEECLGFGRVVLDLEPGVKMNEVVIRNISDIGDFLRREG